jgi:predicted DNA-binding transcriptional regulator AlpA
MDNLDSQRTSNPLLSIVRASMYLEIPVHTFKHHYYNVSNQTAPAPTKIGTRVFFTTKSLDEWVQSNTKTEA